MGYFKESSCVEENTCLGVAYPMDESPRQVFSSTQEDSSKKYLLQMVSLFYGYSPKDVRRLAYEYAEPTSLGRATSFNAQNVIVFFDKLAEVMDKHGFSASDIWNVDETGVSTVLKPNKIVAAKGKRNIGAMASGERGTNVTVVTAVSAYENTVLPLFVFNRKQFKSHSLNGGPPG
ncbi:hypothetical protein Zmor_018900 [Zophobas morio]|uniref:DDE-1 domain-containing protein n=1 Tax=Zophobas morio TaxID=2755281 RepID=A0AA38IFJ2_9CUCU|nr:hypothetical protein Zmor_018900 [Zophobas morio]